jgi:FOG: WD40-like repeat
LNGYPYLTEGVTVDKGIAYAGIGTGLSAYDLKTGQTIWTNKDWKQREGATTTLTIAGNVLISGTQWGGLYGQQKELSANLDVTSTPLVTEQEIVFGTADRGVFALDKSTLFNKWKAETSPSLVYTAPYSSTPQAGVETSPVASQGVVYIGASDGYLYAIDQATGIIKEKYNLGVPVFSTVAVSGNRMIVCDFAGNVYCFASK